MDGARREEPGLTKRLLPSAFVFSAVAILHLAGGLELIERRLMDTRFRFAARRASTEVILVDIDPRSLQTLDVWPWPRGYHATVLEKLRDAGAGRVGFDVDFSSRSDREEDEDLARALELAKGSVVLPVFHQWQRIGPGRAERTTVQPIPELKRHATLGSINVRPGPDGLVRCYGGDPGELPAARFPTFAAALAGDPRPASGSFYIDYGILADTIPRISFADVLTGQFDPSLVEGRAVVIGSTAVELGDQIAVPLHSALPGPLVQALAYESIRQGRTLGRSPRGVTLSVALVLALVVCPLFAAVSWRGGLVLVASLSGATFLLAVAFQRFAPVLLDTSPWLLTYVVAYGASLAARIDQQALRLLAQRLLILRAEGLTHHFVENSFDAILTLSEDGLVKTFNPAAQRMSGYSDREILGRPVTVLIETPRSERAGSWMRANRMLLEAVGRRRDGESFPVELAVSRAETAKEPIRVAFLRDISERKAHEKALVHQATHDPLTELPNRLLLHERAEHALAEASRGGDVLAVLLLDLDGFKEINDTLGHRTGDLLLRQVAQRLQGPLGSKDLIARLGGDEFAVLLPGSGVERARELGQSLIGSLRAPFEVEGLSLQVDTSLGIALAPEHGSNAEALLQRADVAMYAAKRARVGLGIYHPEMDYNSRRHLTLKADLRHAIEDRRLGLAYQPKVAAENGAIVGVEALVRWRHPELGNIPPDEFIGLAEHGGLIRPLTLWVMETALEQGASWQREGLEIGVSVNLSARNLMEEDLPSNLERLLSRRGLPPERLTLELTESMLMEDPAHSLEVVTRLKDLGVGISIDDFGTGYSSLAYLTRLPAREIKIDKSFVMRMLPDPASAAIVRSTIELAHNLGLLVVAEGVESAAVWEALKALGCDYGQGYYFSRPLPAQELEEWMRGRPDARLAARVGAVSG